MRQPSWPAGSLHLLRGLLLAFLIPTTVFYLKPSLAQDKPPKRTEEEDTPKPPMKKPDPPKKEEPKKEEPKKGPSRVEEEDTSTKSSKVIRVDEDSPSATASRPILDLVEAARQAKNPSLRQLFDNLAVPHDLVVVGNNQRLEWVKPVPVYVRDAMGLRQPIRLNPITQEGKPKPEKPYDAGPGTLRRVVHFEVMALEEVEQLLKNKQEGVSELDRLTVAEQILAHVVRYHQSARERGERKGEEWTPVEANLRHQLLEVLLRQLPELIQAKNWDAALNLGRRLVDTYPRVEDQQRIGLPVAEMLHKGLRESQANKEKMRALRRRLREIAEHNGMNEGLKPLQESLRQLALALFTMAQDAEKAKDVKLAQELVKLAEETWSTPELRAFRVKVDDAYPILRVGVRELPTYLSPALAWTDSELRGVELLFESLVKVSPGPDGVMRYESGLAEGRPRIIPLGRQLQLPRNALWSDNQPLTPVDIRSSVTRLKAGWGTGRAPSWGRMLEEVNLSEGDLLVNISLRQGYVDPLSLMTFKIVPASRLPVEEVSFAREPVGSGPFLYAGNKTDANNQDREYAAFVINPNYGARPTKFGLPRIREIRFVKTSDAHKDFQNRLLDMALDLSPEQMVKMRKDATPLRLEIQDPAATVNRRIYFLAVNPRNGVLENAEFRRALALAINRDKLLDTHFRGPLKNLHKALYGPFPPVSWATNARAPGGIQYDPAVARGLGERAINSQANKDVKLTLKYSRDEPGVAAAMEELVQQVRQNIGVEIVLKDTPPHQLRQDVERDHLFELAYFHYDYPDETYALWPVLGPSTAGKNENVMGFRCSDRLATAFNLSTTRRDFTQVRGLVHDIHAAFNADVPFIPLWQLDQLSAVQNSLKTGQFDPILVFTDVEQWRR